MWIRETDYFILSPMNTLIRTYLVLILASLSMALSLVAKAQVHVCVPTETVQMMSGSVSASDNRGHNDHSNHQMTASSEMKQVDHSKMPCCDENSDATMQISMQNHSPCSDCEMQSCGSSSAMLTVYVLSLPDTTDGPAYGQLVRRSSAPAQEWLIPPIN